MGRDDWRSCCDEYRLPSQGGLFWPIPITLSAEPSLADSIRIGRRGGPLGHRDRRAHGHDDGPGEVRDRQGPRVPPGLPHHRREAPRRREGDGPGGGQPGRAGEGALGVVLPGDVRLDLPAPGRGPPHLRGARLEHGRRPAAPQPHAQLARLPGLGGDRGVRRRLRPPARGQAQARRHPGRGAGPGHRRPGGQVLPQGAGRPGRLSDGDALRGAARGSPPRGLPAELRLLPPHRGPRPCRGGRLLRALRRAEDLRRDPAAAPSPCSPWPWTGRSTATSAARWPR